MNTAEFKAAMEAEMRRRLAIMGETRDGDFGRFDGRDWAVVIGLLLALPLLFTWWFAR